MRIKRDQVGRALVGGTWRILPLGIGKVVSEIWDAVPQEGEGELWVWVFWFLSRVWQGLLPLRDTVTVDHLEWQG